MTRQHQESPPLDACHHDLEYYVDAFESAWAMHGASDVSQFLPPPAHVEHHEIVTELLRVDMEHRLDQGSPVSVDDYLNRFPDTLREETRLRAVAYEEYRGRCATGDETRGPADYGQRYGIDTSDWPLPATFQPTDAGPNSDHAYFEAGQTVLEFRILVELGRGTFSRVYLAQQLDLADRFVVLKASTQFWDESDVMARLQHTNIMPIHSVHRVGELQVVCMPYWGHCTLSDLLSHDADRLREAEQVLIGTVDNRSAQTTSISRMGRRDPLDENESVATVDSLEHTPAAVESSSPPSPPQRLEALLRITADIADALHHAHQRGFIHRDLKPANILLADDGRPLVLDFNLAAHRDRPDEGVGGTLPYMAPEHLEQLGAPGGGTTSAASDVFSLGVILFELLDGRRPFPDHDGSLDHVVSQLVKDRQSTQPTPRDEQIPRAVRRIVQKCLEADLSQRYANAAELRDDLVAHLHRLPLPHADEGIQERLVNFAHRHARVIWRSVAVACCALAVIVTVGYLRQVRRGIELQALDAFRSCTQDVEWLTIALTSPVVNDREREQALERSQYWLERGPTILRNLNESDRRHMADRLGEVATALTDVTFRQANSASDARAKLNEALALNRQAQTFFSSPPAALVLQRDAIQAALDGRATNPPRQITAPTTPMGFKLLAHQEFRLGRPHQALVALREANELSPRDYSIWAMLGYVHRALGSYGAAESCFSVCVALRADVGLSYFQRGVARLESEAPKLAEEDFNHYLKVHPGEPKALFNRALARKARGHLRPALSDLEAAVDSEAAESRMWILLSEVRHTLNDRAGGDQALERGLGMVPKDEQNWLARGMAFLRKGDVELAVADFQNGLACNPRSVDARKNLAHVWSDHEDQLDKAIQIMTEAVSIQPSNVELRASRAVLLARAGQSEEARGEIAKALRDDRSVPTLVRAGCVYALTKTDEHDAKLAVQYVRNAVALDPRWARMVARDQDLISVRQLDAFQETLQAAMTLIK